MGRDERRSSHERALRRRFADVGVEVKDAVPAEAGIYPDLLFLFRLRDLCARWRLLALTDTDVQLWTAWSGPTPVKLLAVAPVADLEIRSGEHRFHRVLLGGAKLWVHRRHVPTLEAWKTRS